MARQHIQLAKPSPRGSPSAKAAAAQPDDARMCPSLYLAVYRGRTEEVMALLLQQQHGVAANTAGNIQHGRCNILEVSAGKNTVLHVAAEQGHDELIREICLRFKDEGLLSSRNSAMDTPLHCAARAGHDTTVSLLVELTRESGAESILGYKNEAGDTAVHLAARRGHGAAVEALVSESGAASVLNKAGMSPLYLAVMSRSVPAVRAIITTCKDALSAGPSSQNALHAAVFQSSEMVDLLLTWKSDLAGQGDDKGTSPLNFALSDGDQSIVSAILRAAPPNTVYMQDSNGRSALHVAALVGHEHVVEQLLEAYPDAAELRDGHGRTFLHAAAKEKRSSVVNLAIRKPMLRGLLNAQDGEGNTPLHLAVAAGATSVVKGLLQNSEVQADVLNNDGHTPFDLVAKSTSYFTKVALVVTLSAFGAQSRPQGQDHLNQRLGSYTSEWIRVTYVRRPGGGGRASRHRRLLCRVQCAGGLRRRRPGESPVDEGICVLRHLRQHRIDSFRGCSDPTGAWEGVRLMEELQLVLALHMGFADQHDRGFLGGFECRDEEKGDLYYHLRRPILGVVSPGHLHPSLDEASVVDHHPEVYVGQYSA